MIIVDGKNLAKQIKDEVKEKVKNLATPPVLSCLMVEGDSASEIYVRNKERACNECGLISRMIKLPHEISQTQLEAEIEKQNSDSAVSAILLQSPLPKHLNERQAINKISPAKDVDCLTHENIGKLASGNWDIAPCTPTGIMRILDNYNIPVAGKLAVVVGRSDLVGRPIAHILEQRNATVVLCHSKTQNLPELTRQADILVVAIGKAKFITAEYVKDGAAVIDVGINRENGKLYGDVDYENVKDKCQLITPVPGGVGPLTVACLMENTVKLAQNNQI